MAEKQDNIRKFIENIAVEQQYHNHEIQIKPTTSAGANYTSSLYLATISASGKPDLQLFVKVIILGENVREKFSNIINNEVHFYTKLCKLYKTLEDKYEVPAEDRLAAPKYYGFDPTYLSEILVLENLEAAGYTSFDRFTTVNWEYASKAVEILAKFHALSFAQNEEYPGEVPENLKVGDVELITMVDLFRKAIPNTISATSNENKEKLRKCIDNLRDEDIVRFYKPIRRQIVVHRDFRPSNLMHKLNEDGTYDIKILDFQTIVMGSPTLDLMYFIVLATDASFRRQHYHELVQHYYTQLRLALRRLHQDPDELYPREDFEYELKEMQLFGLVISVVILPIVTVDENEAPRMDNDLDVENMLISGNQLFHERFNGFVNDYIEMGLI